MSNNIPENLQCVTMESYRKQIQEFLPAPPVSNPYLEDGETENPYDEVSVEELLESFKW